MSVIYILLPLALIFSATAVGVFIWATQNGQFDDLDTPGMRILFDDEEHNTKTPTDTDTPTDTTSK